MRRFSDTGFLADLHGVVACIGLWLADGVRDAKRRSRRQRVGPDQTAEGVKAVTNNDYGISPSGHYLEGSAASMSLSRPARDLSDFCKLLFVMNYF